MPGLFGIFSKTPDLSADELGRMARKMARTMQHTPWLKTEIWGDEGFYGGRVQLGVLNPAPQPMTAAGDDAKTWFDGEIYPAAIDKGVTPGPEEILRLVEGGDCPLVELDGVFALACYHPRKRELILANDRLGFRPLYYMETKDWFAYAGEVKALLAICDRLPGIDEISLRQFFGFGHMLGERTWWQGIELLPPASVWRITADSKHCRQYWTFADIHYEPRDEAEVREEFGRLWSQAVRQRLKPGFMPLLLSGGLDSRLLLAELRSQGAEVVAITFGSPDCTDMNIARQVAQIASVPHRPLEMSSENWWEGREEAIWQIDGSINCMDLHVAIAREEMHTGNCLSLHNLAGDVIFGGSKLKENDAGDWRADPNKVLGRMYLPNPFFSREEVVAVSLPDAKHYMEGPSPDCFQFRQRQRRCTLNGPLATSAYCEATYPSLSFPLFRLIYGSLRDKQRINSRFYNKFLVYRYPAYYTEVPWQRNGYGLGKPFLREMQRVTGWFIKGCLRRVLGIDFKPYDSGYADYLQFLGASQIREKLLGKDLRVDQFLDGAAKKALGNYGVNSELGAYALTAILTTETYFHEVAQTGTKLPLV